MPDEALDEHTVARRLGMGVDTLRKLIENNDFPEGFPVSDRLKMWVQKDVDSFLHLRGRGILPKKPQKGRKDDVGAEGD